MIEVRVSLLVLNSFSSWIWMEGLLGVSALWSSVECSLMKNLATGFKTNIHLYYLI